MMIVKNPSAKRIKPIVDFFIQLSGSILDVMDEINAIEAVGMLRRH